MRTHSAPPVAPAAPLAPVTTDAAPLLQPPCAEGAPTAAPATAPAGDDPQLLRWLAAIAQQDEPALAALHARTVSRVHGLVLRIVRRPALAEEVVEDTYFQIWRQALRFDPSRGRAMAWVLGMARSRAIDALRHESRFQHQSLDDDSFPPLVDSQARSQDELIDAARGHALLHQALMGLGAQRRQLVALAFLRGLSHEEIAAQTQLPLGTVKAQIRRSLISLRGCLEPAAAAAQARAAKSGRPAGQVGAHHG